MTRITGVYALVSPLPFLSGIVPPHLLSTISGDEISTHAAQLTSFVVEVRHGTHHIVRLLIACMLQIYGLVLVLLALAELGIFLIKEQVYKLA